jgi:hypothetical protein
VTVAPREPASATDPATGDRALVDAIHRWFDAPATDHGPHSEASH